MSHRKTHKRQSRGHIAAAALKSGAIVFLFSLALAREGFPQPQARIILHPQKVHLNRLAHVTLELLWTGEADLYDIPGPDLSALADFEVTEQSISAVRRGNENFLTYEFTLKPKKEGKYDLGRIKLNYFEKGKDVPVAVALPGASVTVLPPELLSFGAKAGIGAGAAIAFGAMIGFFLLQGRKKIRTQEKRQSEEALQTRSGMQEEFERAKRLLIEGETGRYLDDLRRLMESDALRPHAQKLDDLRALADSLKYGGGAISPDQIEWAEKLVKEAMEKAFPLRLSADE
jgi:hypothetical protein